MQKQIVDPHGYIELASRLMPGEDYLHTLRRLHEFLKPANYLEIGVNTGKSFALASPPTIAIGIDPEPNLRWPPRTKYAIHKLTSDEYFLNRDCRKDIESSTIDFAFIDGLHVFEQALRDFINIEKFAGPRTVVAIHDCLPIDSISASPVRSTVFWSGDVWKILICLRETRPDLDVFTIATPPTGLAIVAGFGEPHSGWAEDFPALAERFRNVELGDDHDSIRESVAAVPNHWLDVADRIRSRFPG